ncbi:hypothetical protein [Altererythrobacter sp. Root672]|uniref:hypothetical protein n=1 Tax=Altererythrobacter sp. Root672 TaxID=1736584 RepID=UPI0006FDF393|nr:hypothetical protein [Altererythrobacter sp. Root672]KRA82669.1 hypothetical protein ASD76_00810 [Altererythrobacter sp. Root672]
MKSVFTTAIALAIMSTPVVAQEAAEAPPADRAKQEKKICRTEKATGSLTRRSRICMTAAEWRDFGARNKRGLDEMNRNASGGKMCVPNPADPFQGCT